MDYSVFKGKKIILIIPNHYKIPELMKYNVERLGMEVTVASSKPFKYKHLGHKLHNAFRKTFYKDRTFKKALEKRYNFEEVLKQTASLKEKADYVLIIRPDAIPLQQTDLVFSLGKRVVAYQWDGLNRYPEIFEYIKKYKHFYSFDPDDYQRYKDQYPQLKLCTNFYFDDDRVGEVTPNNSVYYAGAYVANRIEDTLFLVNELTKYDLPLDINISGIEPHKYLYDRTHINFASFSFMENLRRTKSAKVLLDFKIVEHNGLSMRFFEALKYKKKIITNNTTVVNYDFYNPNNIFILHKDPLERLGDFLHSDYQEVPEEIVQYYAFSSWLYRLLEGEYRQ
ncbi:hypothetical protein SAMN05444369_10653 [Capnocytophaga haemolytica]|jgi:hypothetical protein|uniref:Lipopolysaccharide biosynthesis protein n=1 Tax=Capnocytophaga haemolytica TaxID=45243 RepID=A0AAX2GXJ0_9FLAO|nr:hypothetical protein [Capnocytophaga haemolytica]AMD84556.1 hypothetical protein AXF12_02875 [Capnocytophaga haemolytica]SFN99176.1 hypothetical protein SAMN05444369_10653 [Capnocytophaga haemolytica]SNV09345.1 Uncharacterised protein [Capnocytophaga haemolytica]